MNGADWQHPFGPESSVEESHPVVQVSWFDAAAYCAWVGGSLPAEAQWEKAARGTGGRAYPWGNAFDGTWLNYCDSRCENGDRTFDDGYRFTAPVGSCPAGVSPYGALDMAGNVWEWTADWYDDGYYAQSPYAEPGWTGFRALSRAAWGLLEPRSIRDASGVPPLQLAGRPRRQLWLPLRRAGGRMTCSVHG